MPPPLRCPTSLPSTSCSRHLFRPTHSSRSFTTTSRNEQRITRARRQLYTWLNGPGLAFRDPLPGSTNYLSAYNAKGQLRRVVDAARKSKEEQDEAAAADPEANPEADQGEVTPKERIPPETLRDFVVFPENKVFSSQPVLSESLREEIWSRIMRQGKSVRVVSAELNVEMSRVGAVVRLMEVQREWERIGKPLAKVYSEAVLDMLPKTPFPFSGRWARVHESINDLPVHSATGTQIFHPTSESRHFTRADAAKVFHRNLLPADDRVPHPELTAWHKDHLNGISKEDREANAERREDLETQKVQRAALREAKKEDKIMKVESKRYQFRITSIQADDAGKTGRGANGTGWRYGVPHMDRKRGAVRIPTSVA